MNDELILKIQSFGPINNAELNIGKINMVAGQNASGKTTSSKILYSFLLASSEKGDIIYNNKIIKLMYRLIRSTKNHISREEYFKLSKLETELRDPFSKYDLETKVENLIINISNIIEFSEIKPILTMEIIKEAEKELNIIKNPLKKRNELMKDILKSEFGGNKELYKNFKGGILNFHTKNQKFGFDIYIAPEKNNIQSMKSVNKIIKLNLKNVFHVESPYIFDFLKPYESKDLLNHQNSLIQSLETWEYNEQKNTISLDSINNAIKGFIYFNDDDYDFKFKKDEENEYLMINTAAGMKSLGIIKSLVDNDLASNSFLIMDEPEVHLHPEWQIILAETIVLLAKSEHNINFYINSHSPQFIEAIAVFSEFHDMIKDTNFYLTESEKNSKKFNIKPIDIEDIVEIYDNLGKPYDIINSVHAKNLLK